MLLLHYCNYLCYEVVYYIKFTSWSSWCCHSILCAGLPNPFCSTMQRMASCTWDDLCTDLWGSNALTVGRYPYPSGEASTDIISSMSLLFVKSDILMLMQKLWRRLMHSRISSAVLHDTPNGCFKRCHLVVSNPKAISTCILTWLKKKL